MKNFCIQLFVLLVSSMCISGCSTENDIQLTQKEQNLMVLQSMAKNIGIQVDIKLYDRQATEPLTFQDMEYFRETFNTIATLNGMGIELVSQNKMSRAIEGSWYNGSASFNGHSFNLDVYWKKNNETGDIFDIYGGMAGYAESEINDYQDTAYQTCCEMFHMGQTIHHANNNEISISLYSDYVASQICYDRLNGNSYVMNETICKVTASGIVYVESQTGGFSVQSAGPGSWGDDWRENL